jgi:putative ABC transport system substrate-binding protein
MRVLCLSGESQFRLRRSRARETRYRDPNLRRLPRKPIPCYRGAKRTDMRMGTLLHLFLIVAVLALAEPPAVAQQAQKVPKIGFLGGAKPGASILQSFHQGLRELGYVEGQNFILEPRHRKGDASQFYNLAADLVRLQVDVIVAPNPDAIRAAMKATMTIPIVVTVPGAAIDFVASLERPGGNVTGVSGLTTELGGKWLELIKETIPSTKRVAVFWNRRAEERFPIWKSVDSAARSLGVDLQWLETGEGGFGWLYRNLRSAVWRQADAFLVLPGTGGFRNTEDIAEFGVRNRIPGISWQGDFAEAGGLMSYGANRNEQSRRAAYFVDKILKGAKPGDLPVERPTQFELVINLKTAKEIGVTIHPEVLMWADRVIK